VLAIMAVAVFTPSAATAKEPNLSYFGGPVLHSSAPYLVFWTPKGESIPASSRSLVQRYLTDVAADSGKSTNVFGVLRQYYDGTGFADYRQRFTRSRQVIVDTHAYPRLDRRACPHVSSAYPTCISKAQIESELDRLTRRRGLPAAGPNEDEFRAFTPVYLVVLPADVNVCTPLENSATPRNYCADDALCAYHAWFTDSRKDILLYAAIPVRPLGNGSLVPDPKGVCQADGTPAVQEPNGDAADVVINSISAQLTASITDPITLTAWTVFNSGQEVGNLCGLTGHYDPSKPFGTNYNPDAFLPTLGGSASAGTLYDQLIDGDEYYTQSEWSNGSRSCEMRPSPGRIVPRFTIPARLSRTGASLRFSPAASTSTRGYSSATWNFGDDSRRSFFSGAAALTSPGHSYRKPGRYVVTLTLVDTQGNVQSTTRRVTVKART
jgi:PKD domain